MTNIVHFQPICFLCALDEVSDESNLWSAPHTDNEQYVFGRERRMHKVGLPQWALWWMRAITVDACDFCSMWTANIGLTPQMYVGFFFFFSPISLAHSVPSLGYTHLKKRKKWSSSDIQVARFQQRGKDLLCDNCSCLLATGEQVHVLRGWHMEACVFARVCVCVVCKGWGCGRLSSQQCFKANIANGAHWPAAWRAVQPPAIPASLQSHHWLAAHISLALSLLFISPSAISVLLSCCYLVLRPVTQLSWPVLDLISVFLF